MDNGRLSQDQYFDRQTVRTVWSPNNMIPTMIEKEWLFNFHLPLTWALYVETRMARWTIRVS